MGLSVRTMIAQDYDAVMAVWRAAEGVGLSSTDSPEGFVRFLDRNPGLSFVAVDAGDIVAGVLCGHDGRRGYIHHLAVRPEQRRRGMASMLVRRCLEELASQGIDKCHLFVFADNEPAIAFWREGGWIQRVDLVVMSHLT